MMGTDHVELGEGTLYIDGLEVAVREVMAEGTDLNDIEDTGTYITKIANAFSEFTATVTMSCDQFGLLLGLISVLECPNRRVAHLIRYGKKEKTRKKNLNRAFRIVSKEGRK